MLLIFFYFSFHVNSFISFHVNTLISFYVNSLLGRQFTWNVKPYLLYKNVIKKIEYYLLQFCIVHCLGEKGVPLKVLYAAWGIFFAFQQNEPNWFYSFYAPNSEKVEEAYMYYFFFVLLFHSLQFILQS